MGDIRPADRHILGSPNLLVPLGRASARLRSRARGVQSMRVSLFLIAVVALVAVGTGSRALGVPTKGSPSGVAVNPVTNRVYAANRLRASLTVIDGATNTVIATVPAGSAPQGVAV